MKKSINYKFFAVWSFLIAISFFLLYPQCQNLARFSQSNNNGQPIPFSTAAPNLQSFLQHAGIPLAVKFYSYNLRIANQNTTYNISYDLTFAENDPILPYLEKVIGSTSPTIDLHPGYTIRLGDDHLVRNIPADITLWNRYGSTGWCEGNCPDVKELTAAFEKTPNISACPNIDTWSALAQLILLAFFWIVIINNVYGFFKITLS